MPAVVFLAAFAVYFSCRGTTPLTDPKSTVHVSLSILHEGDTDLDEFSYPAGDSGNALDSVGHRQYFFPLGTSFVILPLMAAVDWGLHQMWSVDLYALLKSVPDWDLVARIHLLIASFITALTVAVIYLMGRLSLDPKRSLLLAFIFAFCTSAWSTASRDLWQHTVSMLLLSVALYLLLLARTRPWLVQCASLPLALAYTVRPTNSIPIVLITLHVLFAHRKYLTGYVLGGLLIAVAFLLLNRSIWANWLPPYYLPGRLGDNPRFLAALAGNLVSPARGLLIYSPVLLFVGCGVLIKIRRRSFGGLDAALLGSVTLHWLAISSFKHWSGGASYGPRFFTDMLPFMMYFLVPVLGAITVPRTAAQWPLASGLALLMAVSFFMHYRGATQRATWDWNGACLHVVESVDDNPARLWDWSDPQFWRGLRPARLSVAPLALCFSARQDDKALAPAYLTISNNGDHAMQYEIEVPRRVFTLPADRRIPAMGYGEPAVTADVAGLDVGTHSLGGIYVAATEERSSRPAAGSPIVVPASLQVLPAAGAGQDPGAPGSEQPCFAPPSDILVGGEVQTPGADQIQALHGPGWYDQETAGDVAWRWAASPAVLYIYSPSRQEVEIAATPIALHEATSALGLGEAGTLRMTTDRETWQSLLVQVGQPLRLTAELGLGWNVLALELEAGNFRPADLNPASGDTRELSFALGPINIVAR